MIGSKLINSEKKREKNMFGLFIASEMRVAYYKGSDQLLKKTFENHSGGQPNADSQGLLHKHCRNSLIK